MLDCYTICMVDLLYTIAAAIDAFNAPLLAAGLLVAGAGFIFLHSKSHAAALVLSSLLACSMSVALKLLFAMPRLDSALVLVTGYRFPSQHALVASAFFGSLCLSAFCLLRSPNQKALAVFVCLAAVVTVAWSRVFLRAHLPIDVIVGSLLGLGISSIVHFVVLRKCCYSVR